jgi:rapamycin-insensitive companion of mTOR
VEREQALKFVRAFIEVPGGVKEISRGIVRGIVACAEQTDDRLRAISMETLAEICKLVPSIPHKSLLIFHAVILDPSLVVAAGGVRILTQVLSDGPYELSDTISLAFLYLLDMPSSRKYIRPGNDIEVSHIPCSEGYLALIFMVSRLFFRCSRIVIQ